MATATNEADEIRRKMALVRRDMHDDVRNVVAGADATTNWKRWVSEYPYACLGAAVALGYLLVPQKRAPAQVVVQHAAADLNDRAARAIESATAPPAKSKSKGRSIIGALLGMATPVAIRAAQGYAVQYFENWINAQQAAMMGMAQPMSPSPGMGGPSGPSGPAGGLGGSRPDPARGA